MREWKRANRALYVVARAAVRPDEDGAWSPHCEIVLTVAGSAEEAERRHLQASLSAYPPEQGWLGHRIAIKPITRREIDFLIGYIAL